MDNGIRMNGIRMNGIRMNGIRMNGIRMNGIRMNGVTLEGTALTGVDESNGAILWGPDFVGTEMEGEMDDGSLATVFIMDMFESEELPGTYLYQVEFETNGTRTNICENDALVIPISGTWDDTATHIASDTTFTFACQGTAIAKCFEWGFDPAGTATECAGEQCEERSLADFHQACTRMVRADYCGDGVAHTENGTTIDVWDALGIMTETPNSGLGDEVEWGVDGAVCIKKTRWRETLGNDSRQYIMEHCPERWTGASPADECFLPDSDFHAENGFWTPTTERKLFRNSTGDNVR